MSGTHLSASERETIVNADDDSDVVRIWTAQTRVITRLRRDNVFTEVASGFHGSTPWAEFTVPADRWSPAGVKRTRQPSAAQLANLGAGRSALSEVSESRKARADLVAVRA